MNKLLPGPLMIDIAGQTLADAERARLMHPLVGGVILFTRNFASPAQVAALVREIRALRPLLVAVDHEGGRVQRFRDGFTRLPPMAALGRLHDRDAGAACRSARALGYLVAVELRTVDVDLTFAPVLDLAYGHSNVIGDRAFHADAGVVAALAGAFVDGLHLGGMAACGKHFPGHGYVAADSHLEIPVDERSLAAMAADIRPYRAVPIDGVMPAHVIYPQVDSLPAGFSPRWLTMLRGELGFAGAIFSDDLSMAAAGVAGDALGRVEAAWAAGCDMLLLCNVPDTVDDVLARWHPAERPGRAARVAALRALPLGAAAAGVCRSCGLYAEAQTSAATLCAEAQSVA